MQASQERENRTYIGHVPISVKQLRTKFDLGLIVVAALATFTAWPLLAQPSLPTMTDAEMHVYRAAEVQYAIEGGVYYPRWAPDFYYGYGYPVFNYYSPLTYHMAAWYVLLTSFDVVAGTKFVLILAAYIGAFGIYLFARQRWSSDSALVATAAWSLAPYVMYIDPHARGDVPETFALALAPAMFWLFDRVKMRGSPGSLVGAAMVLALLILSHPLMALILYGFLLLFIVWEVVLGPLGPNGKDGLGDPRRHLSQVVFALALGLLLAAFYWLPAGVERSAIQLDKVAGAGFFDFRNHFIQPAELISHSPLLDFGATEPAFHFNLGVGQWIVGLIGALTIFVPRLRRFDTIFFALFAIGCMYLMTGASQGFWGGIALMRFFQFPSRFLGPAALAFAALAAMSIRWFELIQGIWPRVQLASAIAIVGIGIGAMPLNFPKPWADFGPVDPNRMLQVELDGRARGTTSADDFLPIDVIVVPQPVESILADYSDDWRNVEKFNRTTLPEGSFAQLLETNAEYDRIAVQSDEAFVFRMYRFYFPGWSVLIDDDPVEIDIAQPDGFITFWVPAGEHIIEVALNSTPARTIGTFMSAAGLAILISLLIRRVFIVRNYETINEQATASPLAPNSFILTISLIVGLFAIRAAADRNDWFTLHSRGNAVLSAEQQIYVELQDEIALLAFDVAESSVQPGREYPVTLYWKATSPPTENYRVFVHLRGEDGEVFGQSDKLNPAGFPTRRWPLDEYVRDEHILKIEDELPAGEYFISTGLWNVDTGQRLLAYDQTGVRLGDSIPLPIQLTVD